MPSVTASCQTRAENGHPCTLQGLGDGHVVRPGGLTAISIAKGRQEAARHHDGAAADDGRPSSVVVGDKGRDEEGEYGANVEHVDEDGELAVEDGIDEVRLNLVLGEKVPVPGADMLRDVDEHAVVARRDRGHHEEDGEAVELPQMGFPLPVDALEEGGRAVVLLLHHLELVGGLVGARRRRHGFVPLPPVRRRWLLGGAVVGWMRSSGVSWPGKGGRSNVRAAGSRSAYMMGEDYRSDGQATRKGLVPGLHPGHPGNMLLCASRGARGALGSGGGFRTSEGRVVWVCDWAEGRWRAETWQVSGGRRRRGRGAGSEYAMGAEWRADGLESRCFGKWSPRGLPVSSERMGDSVAAWHARYTSAIRTSCAAEDAVTWCEPWAVHDPEPAVCWRTI